MKRTRIIAAAIAVCLMIASPAFGLENPFEGDSLSTGFQTFADEVTNALPMNSMIGLQWSDAHIGQLVRIPPNIGVGATVGFTTIPLNAVTDAAKAFDFGGNDLAGELEKLLSPLGGIGLPIPGSVIDARIGGFMLPFDIGIKAGTLPEVDMLDFGLDYLLVGGDVRYRVFDGPAMIPTVSVGAGVNYLRGGVSVPGLLGNDVTLTSIDLPDPQQDDLENTQTYDIAMTDPNLDFGWETTVYDLKAQASTSLFILTPYIGAGVSYARSSAGGGLSSELQVSDESGTLSDAELDELQKAYDQARELDDSLPAIDFTDGAGIQVRNTVNGIGVRIFGGTSFNIPFVRIDLGGMYNVTSNNLGASLGLRIQL